MEQDQYEARLKELFDSFDTTGTGSLGQEELTDLCHMLQLEEVAPSLQQALLQDHLLGRVHFDQFKEALIDALSNTLSNKENGPEPDCSPEAQPKYIKDGKRYGRRSVPELQDSLEEFDEETVIKPEDEGMRSSQVVSRDCDEHWKDEEGEEYEAEGQLRFWNPDDLNASQTVLSPEQDWVEEKLQLICEDLGITRDGHLNRKKLISICEQYGFQNLGKEALEDALQNLDHDDTMSLQDFFYEVCKNTKLLTPSSSTPYRQLKRHLSLQPYDETGRRTLTPSTMAGTIGFRMFSKLDDGTGYGSVEDIIDLWNEEGLENGQAILKALDFNLEGKINLTELTMTLENELLITKNEIYQAALISFRSEISHLLEQTDQNAREKEKLRLDLEKNEKFKSLMATEVDDHHAAIERRNEYNLQKLDEEYKERSAALKSELRKEREQILQQANRQRTELEQELDKVKMEENYLRDRLTLSIKENGRMERELLETSEKLADCESLTDKLQRSLDNILREKFGDLDPSCVEFFLHEEKLMQVRNEYERQRRELQDRIDELQLELEEYRTQGVRGFRASLKNSLFDEMDNRNTIEYDPGIGSEDCPPLNMSIEAEMAIEQMRELHQREVEELTVELESKTTHYEEKLKEAKYLFEREQESIRQKLNDEIHKAEEQVKLFKMRHSELEADIQRLKDERQRAECEHRDQVGRMETEFEQQKLCLVEQEAALQLQLEEARQSYHKEKEELVQRAEDIEKEGERRLVDLVTTYEERKYHLEQTLNEQISNLQERHEVEKQELRSQLLEQNEHELQEEREKMESEYNRKISELEAQFAKDYESTVKKYEGDLVGLDEKFKNDLQDLRAHHAEEKAQWILEKKELVQESVRTQEGLEKEKMSCSELLQEKIAVEKTYKELVNNLCREKEQVQNDLNKLRVSAKQREDVLRSKIIQLESDLLEELTERDEQLCQAEENIQCLRETLVKLEKQHKLEKEELDSKLSMSEARHKEVCDRTEKKRAEMFEEITRLQSTINELKDEIMSLSKVQTEYKLLENENSDLKNVVSQLQNSSAFPEEEGNVLKSLQTVYEHTVKENISLLSEISRLKEKLDLSRTAVGNEVDELGGSELEKNQSVKTLEMELMDRDKRMCPSEKNVQTLQETTEKLERDHRAEKDLLEVKLSKSEELYKELCERTDKKRQEMFVEISRLQSTIHKLQNEIMSLSQIQIEFSLVKKENAELREAVSDLQNSSNVLEEERGVLKSLKNVHQQAVKENVSLQSQISRLKEKLGLAKLDIGNTKKVNEFGTNEADNNQFEKTPEMELMDRYERLCHAEKYVQTLQEAIKQLESDHIAEKDILKAKLSASEELHKEMCERTDTKRQEMLVEITRLQSTINELQNEITSLSQIQVQHTLIKKENAELRKVVSDLQNSSMVLDEERGVLKSLQNVHEQTVKDNVELLSKISNLQEKLNAIEGAYDKLREATENPIEKLQEELDNRDEKLCQAVKKIQLLHETIEKLDEDHELEKEDLNSKLLESKRLYKNVCDEAEKERAEITRLQSTIKELKNEMAPLYKIQGEYRLMEKGNSEFKLEPQLQNGSAFLEDDIDVFRSLQNVHEQTVKDNVRLLSEISRLQKKIGLLEKKTSKDQVRDQLEETEAEENQFGELVFEVQGEPNVQDIMPNKQYMEALENVNTKLQNKTKELEDTTEVLCKLEKGYREVKNENDYLRTQIILLQENLNNLTLEYDQVKKAVNLEEIPLPELEEAPITIPGLKLLFTTAKKENVQLQERLKFMELKNAEAFENNKLLSSEVSWLQTEIQNMEEMTEASLKLEQLYEEAKKENDELKALVHLMQENILRLERTHVVKSMCASTEMQTKDLKTQIKSLEWNLEAEEHSAQDTMFQRQHLLNSKVENVQISPYRMALEYSTASSAQRKHNCPEDHSEMQKQMRKVEDHGDLGSSHDAAVEDDLLTGSLQEPSPRRRCLNGEMEQKADGSGLQNEIQKKLEHLRCRNKHLKEENAALVTQISTLKEEGDVCNQKTAELLDACEEMWVNLETAQNEKLAMEKMVDILTSQVAESKTRNEQLVSENEELYLKNSKNQEDLKDLNRRLVAFLKQKDKKDSAKGLEEWQKEKCQMSEEIEGYRSKISDSEKELSKVKVNNRSLEQENALLKQEMGTKQLSKSSEITDLKNEISLLMNKNEKLLKEKETLGEELNNCVAKSAKVGHLESKIVSLKQEQKTWEQQSHGLRNQVSMSQEKIQNLEENLQSVNLQLSRIKSDLRVAHQEKESLKQEVMSLHKQLQNANTKKQVLEMAMRSSGLQGQQKKKYWDDLEQLMEQEQQLLRQENERLQREVQNTKTDLTQSREKVRHLESSVIALKHHKQLSQSSLVKALEQEKSSLRRECDQLQKDLTSANRKISQLSAFERDSETIKAENEGVRTKQGKFEDHITEMLHSPTSAPHSRPQLQQQACATVPREQYLQLQQQLQQLDRRNQQLQAAMDHRSAENNAPQALLQEQRALHADSYRRIGRL
ncbi:ninein isoform X2 [Mixophyes fleayi]|uniref:ninein isoform X2 n=1 Tax=Mixophyes fleayi TaxID=3061075 RepID=UPI003F4DF569